MILDAAIALAEAWQDRAADLLTADEKILQEQLERLLTHPTDKVVLIKMIDQGFRSRNALRVADQMDTLLREYGAPDFFSSLDKILVQIFLGVGRHFPNLSVRKMIEKMRHDSSRAIIPGEPDIFRAYLKKRRQEGVRINTNHLGEAVLGEGEAEARLKTYLEDLRNPDIEYISVKISTIYSQIQPLAFEHTVAILQERLTELFLTAAAHQFVRADGSAVPKFVNLDMEEYRDLDITWEAFRRVLDEDRLLKVSAGIVLQAYLPDAYPMQRELTRWARARVARGGAPIKVRVVKGANLEMERLESVLRGWPLAPYDNKRDVDANFKRMIDYATEPENIAAVHLGIGSHNLFELAYAWTLAQERGVTPLVTIEMLEGMADHVRRAIQETSGNILLYAPVATRDQFINAIGYLIRRLDENTGEENFLRYACHLSTDAPAWSRLKEQFVAAYHHRDTAGKGPRRSQDRGREDCDRPQGTFHTGEFRNEPDTDWALAANRRWAADTRARWRRRLAQDPLQIPLVVAGEEIQAGRPHHVSTDPSLADAARPAGPVVAVTAMAEPEDLARAVAAARQDPAGWRSLAHRDRHALLAKVAVELRRARGDLMALAAANTGKVFTESDVEVSEAVDFAEYYGHSAGGFHAFPNLAARGKGVGVVISPWNFPIAIPCGGILASLAAGNTVIFKPATAAVAVAWRLSQCFWNAGVSRSTLQFLPCAGATVGDALVRDPDIDYVILTGGTDTGLHLLQTRPDLLLAAETGGKNATILTGMSDRDQAIRNVIHSAFSNCGQKCSATSLLILEREVYEDPQFKRQLLDAAQSYAVGSAWEFASRMGPLIAPPRGELLWALTELDPGESWLLKPGNLAENPYLWSPGIKWDVQPGSRTHMTEFFGPVLGVMCAEDLDHAIDLVNQTGYGLTSGLESLDTREQAQWQARIRAGNLYINRGTTGAVVLRQPFGGMGKSALGAGIKVGGPNYVAQFMDFKETSYPAVHALRQEHALGRLAREWNTKLEWGLFTYAAEDLRRTVRAIASYLFWAEQEFHCEKDYFHLTGQDNRLRYLPAGRVVVRLHPADTVFDTLARIAAARIAGCQLLISRPADLDTDSTRFLAGPDGRALLGENEVTVQSDADLIRALPQVDRIRYAAADRVPQDLYRAAAREGFPIARRPVMMEGRIELLHYFQEQSICNNYHRYGNLGDRTMPPGP